MFVITENIMKRPVLCQQELCDSYDDGSVAVCMATHTVRGPG